MNNTEKVSVPCPSPTEAEVREALLSLLELLAGLVAAECKRQEEDSVGHGD
jgi:hypothetical protein